MSLTCILVGDESLLIQCAAVARQKGHRVQGLVTSSSTIEAWARQEGISCYKPGPDAYSELAASGCDVLFSIANLRVLPQEALGIPRLAAINFHDGPLPDRAGLNVTTWAIHEGATEHGITWHLMTAEVDSGKILVERRFPIDHDESAFSLNVKCYEAAVESFEEVLERLAESPLRTRRQDEVIVMHRRNDRPPLAAILNWEETTERLFARVRALDFGSYANPLALPKLLLPSGNVAIVRRASPEARAPGSPGTIIVAEANELIVATSDSGLRLSGLTDMRGTLLDLEAEGLREGVVLPTHPTSEADRLDGFVLSAALHESYWRRELASIEPTHLPYEKPGVVASGERRTISMEISDELRAFHQASSLSRDEEALQDAAIAGFGVFLARLARAETISVGLRGESLEADLKGLPPIYAAVVPFGVKLGEHPSVVHAAQQVAESLLEIRGKSTYPLDLVLRSPEILEPPQHPIVLDMVGDFVDAPLVIRFYEDGKSDWVFDTALYDEESIKAMQNQFRRTVAGATSAPESQLFKLDILEPDDRNRLLVEWNQTDQDGDMQVCVHQLIERQTVRTPDSVAIRCGGDTWTYAELNDRANRVAQGLKGMGVSSGAIVGVYLERSAWMVASLLGVLKSGAAYVPLDPDFPSARLAFMVEDAALAAIVVESADAHTKLETTVPALQLNQLLEGSPTVENLSDGPSATDLAYVLYTSGSTGQPKGVMVEHRNVVNFFLGMDDRVGADEPGVWLALTSISFDISVLELFWTLSRGFTVVVQEDERIGTSGVAVSSRPMDFSLFYFASDEGGECAAEKYKLLLDGARFADTHGFEAVWTPERHFHAFGGLYPNPSVASAALSTITSNIGLRAGSCVSPLHHPARIAEEWGVVDVLSNGRVGISFAAGWQPNDFVLRPEGFADRKERMFEQIEQVKALWRGESLEFDDPNGKPVSVRTLPRPVQAELPVWVTAAGNPETFREAGAQGYNLLTHLLGQRVEDLAEKIGIYRRARKVNGHDPASGRITLMLHTFVGDDDDTVRELVRGPMKDYLKSSIGLIQAAAWSFPTFRQKTTGEDGQFTVQHLSEEALDEVLDFSFERYFETSALFGNPETCGQMVEKLKAIGVDEIACLIDYGVETETVLSMLPALGRLRDRSNSGESSLAGIADNLRTHDVTHLQCTPTQAGMLVSDPEIRDALSGLDHLLVGGEAFSGSLAARLAEAGVERITNMYGPTETTIWSATHAVSGSVESTVPLGRPIANTTLYVLDEGQQPVPLGLPGELCIGGAGVARGYHNRPKLTAERFTLDPFRAGGRMYRTGDRVRYSADGMLEFLGRLDNQVKLRGYRIELGEIEAALGGHPDVSEAAVVIREDSPGDQRIVAYCTATNGRVPDREALREFLGTSLPEYMVPTAFVALEAFPITPNRKLDRNALPSPSRSSTANREEGTGETSMHSELEKQVVAIWEDVLGIDGVSPGHNFFDLGGHSLMAMQVQAGLREKHGHDVRIVDLFRFPTVRSLAQHLKGAGTNGESAVVNSGADRGARRAAMMQRRTRPPSEK